MGGETIAVVKGDLHLTIAGSEPIHLGQVTIPITATGQTGKDGDLILKATPNMWEVREFVEQVFAASTDLRAIESEAS